MPRMLRRVIGVGLFSLYGTVLGWVLLFLLIELSPNPLDVIRLQDIRYYAQKHDYVSDPHLVVAYRRTNYVRRARFVGDLYSPHYGAPAKAVDYVATYDANGFRKNSSEPPYDIAVIGDSYIEFGESDEKTFTELLKRETGRSVANFGRGWYGPYQYLEVLNRYVLKARPRYVLFAFFAGNDFNDISQYEAWLAGEPYYWFRELDKRKLVSRFALATGDVGRFFKGRIRALLTSEDNPRQDESNFGLIDIGDKEVPMVLARWEREITKEEISALRSILREFKSHCDAHGIIPLVT